MWYIIDDRGERLEIKQKEEKKMRDMLQEGVLPTRTLHEFALWCAEEALAKAEVGDERCWNALKVKRLWLEGAATDNELAAARDAARAATRDIAKAARAAARDAAMAAARDAAEVAARVAAQDAARVATWIAKSAGEAAWYATWETAGEAAWYAAEAAVGVIVYDAGDWDAARNAIRDDAVWSAMWNAAWAAAREGQLAKLKEMALRDQT